MVFPDENHLTVDDSAIHEGHEMISCLLHSPEFP